MGIPSLKGYSPRQCSERLIQQNQVCIFSGSSHPRLVDAVCERLGQKPSNVALKKFANGETSVEISSSARIHDFHVQILIVLQRRPFATKMSSSCKVGAESMCNNASSEC